MHNDLRKQAYQRFVRQHQQPDKALESLPGDASARRYFRLPGTGLMLMDMPPELLDLQPYVRVAAHLRHLDLRVPTVRAYDLKQGLALIEDFGDNTFSRLLAEGETEQDLYTLAIDQLIHLHQQAEASAITVPCYDEALLLREAARLPNWFYPSMTGAKATPVIQAEYLDIWRVIVRAMPEPTVSLVLVDFHVENLIRLPDGGCGILDFQDARIGPTAYDVMSLLEDARRDVSPSVAKAAKARYLASRPNSEWDAFEAWYAVLAAQRHCKVLGLFLRLCITAGKCQYLVHIPRVVRLLERHLQEQARLKPLRDWLEHYLPLRLQALPELDRSRLQTLLQGVA